MQNLKEDIKNHKRNIILKIAKELFCQKGFHEVSTSDIAKACGYTKSALYYYFTNKEEIFIEVMCDFSLEKDEALKSYLNLGKTNSEKLAYLFRGYLLFVLQDEMVYSLYTNNIDMINKIDDEVNNRLYERGFHDIVDIVADCHNDGYFHTFQNTKLFMPSLWAMIRTQVMFLGKKVLIDKSITLEDAIVYFDQVLTHLIQ